MEDRSCSHHKQTSAQFVKGPQTLDLLNQTFRNETTLRGEEARVWYNWTKRCRFENSFKSGIMCGEAQSSRPWLFMVCLLGGNQHLHDTSPLIWSTLHSTGNNDVSPLFPHSQDKEETTDPCVTDESSAAEQTAASQTEATAPCTQEEDDDHSEVSYWLILLFLVLAPTHYTPGIIQAEAPCFPIYSSGTAHSHHCTLWTELEIRTIERTIP